MRRTIPAFVPSPRFEKRFLYICEELPPVASTNIKNQLSKNLRAFHVNPGRKPFKETYFIQKKFRFKI